MRGCDERRRAHKIAGGACRGGWEGLAVKGGKGKCTRTGGAPTEEKNTGGNCNSAPGRTHGQVSCCGWLRGAAAVPLPARYLRAATGAAAGGWLR